MHSITIYATPMLIQLKTVPGWSFFLSTHLYTVLMNPYTHFYFKLNYFQTRISANCKKVMTSTEQAAFQSRVCFTRNRTNLFRMVTRWSQRADLKKPKHLAFEQHRKPYIYFLFAALSYPLKVDAKRGVHTVFNNSQVTFATVGFCRFFFLFSTSYSFSYLFFQIFFFSLLAIICGKLVFVGEMHN